MIILALLTAYLMAEVVCRIHDRIASHWQARVYWDGVSVVHKCASLSEGLQWAACYPCEAAVMVEHVFHKRATLLASRIGV